MSLQVGLAVHLDFKFICGKKIMILYRDVTSYKELWEGNGNEHSRRGWLVQKKFENRYRVGEGVCEDFGRFF